MPVNEGKWSRGAAIGLLFYDFCESPRAANSSTIDTVARHSDQYRPRGQYSARSIPQAVLSEREQVDLVWTMSKKNPMFYLYFIVGLDYRVTRSHR